MMKVSVLFFAALRVRLAADRLDFELPEGATVRDLVQIIGARHPEIADILTTVRVAIDQSFAAPDEPIRAGVEIAVIPPVSGGHDGHDPARCRLSEAPLELAAAVAAVEHAGAGGITTFIGNVRDRSQGKAIAHLEYEAYAPMALKVMGAIIDGIEASIAGARVAIHHRIGRLRIGESAVIIAASAPHRAEAFAACREAIEALKRDVPIWKREVAVDGETWFGRGP